MGTNSFVGRDLDLERLHEQLQQENRIVITAVTGMGGVGKTELAVQYAQRYWQEMFPGGVCWLSARGAESDADIGTQMITFGKSYLGLNPPEELDAVGQVAFCWWQWPRFDEKAQKPESVLVVLDDVTDYRQVEPYLPRDDRFTVLMTTRVELGSRIAKLPIGVLARADALELLRQLAGAERIDAEPETADALCEWLGDLPLGLELVGRFLARKPDLSLVELREKLRERELQARALKQTEEGMTANLSVASAFELSWQELSEEAQELACLLSCFALAPIPWERVEACMPEADSEELEDWRDEELVRLSLLKRVEARRYQYHQLIQRFIRTKLPEDSPLIGAFCQVMVAAAQEVDHAPTEAEALAWNDMVPHVAEAATQWLAHVADEDLTWPFIGLGRFYKGQGLYAQAEPWHKLCLIVTHSRLGERHSAVAASFNNLGLLYYLQGHYSEAEPLYLQALELGQQALDNRFPEIVVGLNNLARLYCAQGRYSKAELLCLEALELGQRVLDDEYSILIMVSLNDLAGLYHAQCRYSEAEELYLRALGLGQHILDADHPHLVTGISNLANLYQSQCRYDEAESLYLEILELRLQILSSSHPDLAHTYSNLAGLYRDQGRYDEAELLYLKALELGRHELGDNHPHVATRINNLAELYRIQGRHEEAEPLYLQALELNRQLLGHNHPDIAIVLNNLANLYFVQERDDESESLYLQALALTRQILGDDHLDVACSLNNLGNLYRAKGKYDEAEGLHLEALNLVKRLLGKKHVHVATSLNNLALLYHDRKLDNKAEELYLEASEICEELLGDKHPSVANTLNNLAELYKTQQRYSEAEPLYTRVLTILSQYIGENHPNTQQGLVNFRDCLRKALEANQADSLSDHPLTQQLLAHLRSQPPKS